jgi:hypothetical protein
VPNTRVDEAAFHKSYYITVSDEQYIATVAKERGLTQSAALRAVLTEHREAQTANKER